MSSGPGYNDAFSTRAGGFNQPGAAAGDVVVASLFQSATSTGAEIHGLTNGEYCVANNTADQGDTVVDLGAFNEVQGGIPAPTFSKVKITNATVNGDYLGFDSPTEVNALNGGDLLMKAGPLVTSGTGSTFSVKFKHAS